MDLLSVAKLIATLFGLAGALCVLLGLPGTFITWLGVLLAALITKFQTISGLMAIGLLLGCIVVEFAESLLSGLMVAKMGASRGSMVMAWLGSLLGALVGGFLGSMASPIGSLILALLGAFAGGYLLVFWWEKRKKRPDSEAARAAFGTVIGRLLGIILKLAWIGIMLALMWTR